MLTVEGERRERSGGMGATKGVGGIEPTLASLPPEIIELIALYCAFTPPPSTLASGTTATGSRTSPPPPSTLRNLLLTNRRMHSLLDYSSNPRLYARVFKGKFDVDAIARRFGSSAVSGRNLTMELQKRCVCLKRMRKSVMSGSLFPDGDNEKSRMEMEELLWLAYMMMMENDGLNILQLQWARIEAYLLLHHTEEMLASAYKPEFPQDTTDRALALHLQYLLCDPDRLNSESRDESDEKLFVLRPFVFAAHRFDAFYAPWTARILPNDNSDESDLGSESLNPFVADLRIRDKFQTIRHCGKLIRLCPPNASHAACYSFFLKVERDPTVTGVNDLIDFVDIAEAMAGRRHRISNPDSLAISSQNPLDFKSTDHDRDMLRLFSCISPRQCPGLKTCFHLGQLEGSWEGRFAYFDFDSYRDMLSGKLRSLYEGPFGEQPHVWKVKEHIVKLHSDESPGGTGSSFNAGYHAENDEPTDRKGMSLAEAREKMGKDAGSGLPEDIDLYPDFDEEMNTKGDDDYDDDRYEILLSGTGHSAWGRFVLRGRVRSWDGLVTMTKEYRPDGRGRWLYRGYVVAGGRLVGRWRDTFTPVDMCGYEGSFLLHRRSE